ncbi:hypothetical protein RYA05_04445 [Pseudomonas syringae pv. actinidiae]|nr:hypothetical protein [Pseudomonas syringae pv. actinidiae]
MKNNCSPQTFKAGLIVLCSALSDSIRKPKFKPVIAFFGKILAVFLAAGFIIAFFLLFFQLANALIMLLGFAKIHLLGLPIDISNESIWLSFAGEQRIGVTRSVFDEGYGVFLSIIVLLVAGFCVYFGCKGICEMGRAHAEGDSF